MNLRPADYDDCELLWKWANDPVARAASFQSEPIPWSDHVAWFEARSKDPMSRIYIIEEAGTPAGLLRFDLHDRRDAIVSINIAPPARGRGLAARALRLGCKRLLEEGVPSVTAYIKPANVSSLRVFERAGFALAGSALVAGSDAIVMRLHAEGA